MAFDLDSTKHIKSSEKASGSSGNVFGEFANSLIYSAIEEPLLGLSQIIDKTFNNKTIGTNVMPTINEAFAKVGITASQKAEFGSMRWGVQQLGGAVGMMLPFMLCRKAVQASAIKFFGEAAIANGVMDLAILSKPNFLKLAAKEMSMSAATGFSYDSIFRPSQNYIDKNGKERSFLSERLINGATGAATFATLSGCGLGLRKIGLGQAIAGKDLTSIFKNELTANEKLRLLSSEVLRNPISNSIVSAVPAGLVSAEGQALSSERLVPTIDEAKESIGSFAFIGSALGTAHHLGAQREGSARTNLDYIADKAVAKVRGKTVNSEFENKRTFKHLSDGDALKQFSEAVKSGKDAEIILPVREYLGKGIFGGGLSSKSLVGKLGIWGDKYGEVRQIILKHEGKPLNIQQAGQAGLIASCQLLGSELGPRAVFKQNQAGENPVWLSLAKKDHFVLSTDKGMEPKADSKTIRLGDEVVQEGLGEVDLILSEREKELEAHLLNGNWRRAKQFIYNKLVTEEFLKSARISQVAESALEEFMLNGEWYAAQELMKIGLVTEESLKSERISEAAESLLEKLLLKDNWCPVERIMKSGLASKESLKSKRISGAAESALEQFMLKGYLYDAKELMKSGLVTEEPLKSERINQAAAQALKTELLDGTFSFLDPIIKYELLDDRTFNDIFIESIQAGQVTSTIRAALTIGKDFKKISADYLGALSLTDAEAVKLFENMKEQDKAWCDESDIFRFEDGATEFGCARMLRYVHSAKVSPHEILDGFGDVLQLYRSSGLSSSDFYNNILSQVSRDNAINDTGHSFARLKSIAANYSDKSFSVNFDLVMDKARKYFKVKDIEELSAKFPDKQSVFASWPRLVQFAKLEYYINQADLLPEIQRLKASGDSKDVRRAKWLETLGLHADSNVQKDAIDGFLLNKNPYKFLDRDDEHSSVLHQHLKPSNYVRISNLDLTAGELRDALIDGTLDRLQSFTPMKVEYEVGGVELASELKRAFGSSEKGIKGEAQNPGKLFSQVSKLLKESNLTVSDLLNGLQISSELDGRIKALLYNKEVGLANQPSTLKFIAEIHRKSDPVAVIAGDDTASCDQFGSGKKNVYMFNPNNADFTMRLVRPDGTKRTIAQSLLSKDMSIKELVPEVMEKAKSNKAIHNIFSPESVRKGKDVIALDNVEVNANYTSAVYQNAIEAVCRDFFTRYVELYAEKENLQKDKVAVGKGHSDALNALPEEDNRSLPKAPIAYSDKSHEHVRKLSLSIEQGKQLQLKATLPKQVVRSNIPVSGANLVSALTFEDVLPLSYLESKIYKEVPALQQGLYDLENTLIAKDINNAAKDRPNLSFKYTDRDGNMRGYILAYEGKVKTNGVEQPVIYLMDFASDSYLDAGKPKDHGDAGGKVLMRFARAYKQNYLDKGNMMPIFTNARSETSYAMLMKHMQVLGRKSGYDFKIDELGKSNRGGTTMHDVVIVPTHKRE